jgi:ubiquinone/menaquinone biosynthesis C-methylase UbiE
MNEETLRREYYKKMAPIYDRIFFGEIEGEFHDMNQHIINLVNKWSPDQGTILEVGCGTGYWFEYLAKNENVHITGVDISSDMLEIAASKVLNNTRIHLYEGDICNMDFLRDNMFDFVFCAWVLQYLIRKDDFRKGLKELNRVTRPGGLLFIAEDSPPTKAPFTDCLVERDELGGTYFYKDQYEEMTLPVYRRLLEKNEMVKALTDEGLTLLFYEQMMSLKVYVSGVEK